MKLVTWFEENIKRENDNLFTKEQSLQFNYVKGMVEGLMLWTLQAQTYYAELFGDTKLEMEAKIDNDNIIISNAS